MQDSSPRGTAGDTARRELRIVDEQRPCREHARSRSCGVLRKRVRDPSAETAGRDARGREGDWELRGKGRIRERRLGACEGGATCGGGT